MHRDEAMDELMTCRLDQVRKAVGPCTLVIFGASGDLTARKLIPALYHLSKDGQMPADFRIVGFARRAKSAAAWRVELREALAAYSRSLPVDEAVWEAFAQRVEYCQGDLTDAAAYARLAALIGAFPTPELRQNLLFYLATSPSQFGVVAGHLHAAQLLHRDGHGFWQRLVIEKPFGHDLESARELNHELTRFAHEQQVFRIDHYLGKETVQNILTFRFANSIFERLWNRDEVDHIHITVSEKIGVGSRGGYYVEAGALRDMLQNQLMEVLAFVTMEPPVSLDPEPIRDEKVKLLSSVRRLQPGQVADHVVRGQYREGFVTGEAQTAYRDEPKVNPQSDVETFVAVKLYIDNWRWAGVPIYLRTGKALPLSASEVRVQFKPTPNVLFAAQCGPRLDANSITLRLQPNEGITLRFNGKVPGASTTIRPVRMHFSYDDEFGTDTPEAYERLLLEAIAGDPTLFIRRDEVETAWRIMDPIRADWGDTPLTEQEFYPWGSWGPAAANELLAPHGRDWRNPEP